MTLAVEAPVRTPRPARRRPAPRGWRPRGPWDVCSLGWTILDWTWDCLPNPRDRSQRLVLTSEQARRVLRIYELDPVTGRRLYDRVHQEEAKGWGKGPMAAMLALAEFGGAPVVFDGWDADGQPVGKPWGSRGLPAPYVQVVAVSEAQTFYVWQMVMALADGARGELAFRITVDSGRPGRTMLRRTDMPDAEMARTTASAASRTGAPVVHGVFDEVQLWLPDNGGPDLANVVMANLDKTGGWGHFLANAPIMGQGSVAETWGKREPRALFFATRPSEEPQPDWPDEWKRDALAEVYRDAPWIDIVRQLDSLKATQVPWSQTLRAKFNVRTKGQVEDPWMPADEWADREGPVRMDTKLPTYACVRVAHDHRSAAIAIAQRQGERVMLRCRTYPRNPLPEGEYVDAETIEKAVLHLRRRFPARVTAEVTFRPGGKAYHRPKPGPLVLHHGAFFEPSRQRLERQGVVTLDVPSTPERLTPAAETLMRLVTSGELVHDGDPELARQMGRLVAKERPKGWAIESGTGDPIVAAQAAMLAVHWAMTAPAPRRPGRVHGL